MPEYAIDGPAIRIVERSHAADAKEAIQKIELHHHLIERVPPIDKRKINSNAVSHECRQDELRWFLFERDDRLKARLGDMLSSDVAPLRALKRIDHDVAGGMRQSRQRLTDVQRRHAIRAADLDADARANVHDDVLQELSLDWIDGDRKRGKVRMSQRQLPVAIGHRLCRQNPLEDRIHDTSVELCRAGAGVAVIPLLSRRGQLLELLTSYFDLATNPRREIARLVVFVGHRHQPFSELADMSQALSQFLPFEGHAAAGF